MTDKLKQAIQEMERAFTGKLDKGGEPYYKHCLRVMRNVPDQELLRIVAVLHDLVEDCPKWTIEMVSEQFGKEIAYHVDILTRRRNETYDAYISRVETSYYALLVKKADLEDNMDITRLFELTEKDIERLKKYHKVYRRILFKISEIENNLRR